MDKCFDFTHRYVRVDLEVMAMNYDLEENYLFIRIRLFVMYLHMDITVKLNNFCFYCKLFH